MQEEVQLLIAESEGAKNFDPSGKNRPMKDWIQVPGIYKEDWKSLGQIALDFQEANS